MSEKATVTVYEFVRRCSSVSAERNQPFPIPDAVAQCSECELVYHVGQTSVYKYGQEYHQYYTVLPCPQHATLVAACADYEREIAAEEWKGKPFTFVGEGWDILDRLAESQEGADP